MNFTVDGKRYVIDGKSDWCDRLPPTVTCVGMLSGFMHYPNYWGAIYSTKCDNKMLIYMSNHFAYARLVEEEIEQSQIITLQREIETLKGFLEHSSHEEVTISSPDQVKYD